MSDVARAISIARRRMIADQMLRNLGVALTVSISASLALLLLARLLGFALPWSILACLIIFACLWAAYRTWRCKPSAMQVSIELDHRLGLKDRLGSALAVTNQRGTVSAFGPLVIAEAQQLASSLDIRRAAPIRTHSSWGMAMAALMAFVLCALFVPTRTRALTNTAPAPMPAELAHTVQAIDQTASQAIASLDAPAEASDEDAEANAVALDERIAQLDELAQQLTKQDPTQTHVTEARQQASAELNKLSEQLASRSEQELAALEELSSRFDRMRSADESGDLSPELRDFIESMSQGAFGDAAEALDRAAEQARTLEGDAKRNAIEQLRELSDRIASLDDSSDDHAPEPDDSTSTPDDSADLTSDPSEESSAARDQSQREQTLREALEDLGMSREDVDRLMQPEAPSPPTGAEADPTSSQNQPADEATAPSHEDTVRQLREHGADDELAGQLAKDIEQLRDAQSARSEADRKADELAESIRRTAHEAQSSTTPPENTPRTKPPSPPDQQTSPTPSAQEEIPTAAEQTPNASQPSSQSAQEQPESDSPQTSPDHTPTPNRDGEQSDPADQARPDEPATSSGDDRVAPEEQAGTAPSETPQDAPSMLRELERLRDQAQQQQQYSEQMRQRARELADTLSPEQKRELERWASAQQREDQPAERPDSPQDRMGSDHSKVDANRPQHNSGTGDAPGAQPGDNDRTGEPTRIDTTGITSDLAQPAAGGTGVGELPGDEHSIDDPSGRVSSTRLNRAAQRAAERAIEQGEIPSRYHRLIRRYFRTLGSEARPTDD